jgi:gliding motility-associated-like protein
MVLRSLLLLIALSLPLKIFSQNCIGSSSITITPSPGASGCYPAGTTVTVCVSITNYSQGGINWIHGIVVSLGPGWDPSTLAPVSASPSCDGQGVWGWFTSCTSTNTGQTFGPGFYYDTPLGSTTGVIDGIPGNNYGDNCQNFTWNFCFSVSTNASIPSQVNGNIGVMVYGDYNTGSWTTFGCTPQLVASPYCIQQNCSVQLPTLITTNPLCHGDTTGTAFAAGAGGQPPYSYLWSTGATTQSISGLGAGIYSVTVTDAFSCTKNVFFQITEPDEILNNATVTDIQCSSSNTGSVNTSVTGGTPPYSYLWSNGATTSSITGLAAGVYTLTLTDANGCIKNYSYTISASPPVSFTTSSVPATCGQANGSASVTISSGTGPFTYVWNPNVSSGPSANNLAAGNYTVTVTDANGCSDTQTITVTEIPTFTLGIQSTPVGCTGNGATATVTVNGGVGPFTYQWSPTGGSGPTASNLSAGTYTVTVTDGSGCTLTASVVIAPYTPMSLSVTSSPALCDNASSGTATVSVSGGDPGYTYQWSNGATSSTATGLSPGTYTVTVTDASSCTATTTVSITQNPQVFVSISGNNDLCEGQSTTLTSNASGGSGGNQFLWSNGSATSVITVTPPTGINVYTVTVTDVTGCTATATYAVNVTPIPLLSVSGDVTICSGASTTLTATGATTYTWTPATGLDNPSSPTPVASPPVTTIYTITGANGNCTSSATLTVTVSPPVIAAAIADTTKGFPPLTVSFTNQSTGGVSYLWNFGDGTSSTLADPQHTFTEPGVYFVQLIVTNSDGCTDTLIIRVEVELTSALSIPNVFTPNSDGLNDLFAFTEEGILEVKAEIYNRWGNKIYDWNKTGHGWNGITKDGKEAPEGTYFIIVNATGQDGRKYEIAQSFLLIRSEKK